jgi:hypothetical protein
MYAIRNFSKHFFHVFFIYASIESEQLITKNWFLAFEKVFLGQQNLKLEMEHFFRKKHHFSKYTKFSILFLFLTYETIFSMQR